MPILFILQQYQEVFLTLLKKLSKKNLYIFIGIFYPLGEPRLLGGVGWRRRCSPFAVYKYSFMGHFLADAAILARE
jgi:hypothetical protein